MELWHVLVYLFVGALVFTYEELCTELQMVGGDESSTSRPLRTGIALAWPIFGTILICLNLWLWVKEES